MDQDILNTNITTTTMNPLIDIGSNELIEQNQTNFTDNNVNFTDNNVNFNDNNVDFTDNTNNTITNDSMDITINNNTIDNDNDNNDDTESTPNGTNRSLTRFKWTKEKSQVAMNLVKHGCKPKLVAVAVGCSLRTAQKFVETVTPKIEGESFKNYEIRRRGRKSKDVNERLDAIRDVLSKDSSKTQVEIAADLKVSNTTVCRDLKRIGTSWKKKRKRNSNQNASNGHHDGNSNHEESTKQEPQGVP